MPVMPGTVLYPPVSALANGTVTMSMNMKRAKALPGEGSISESLSRRYISFMVLF
jgi:hypothetical protein